jgi:hypothetical protein
VISALPSMLSARPSRKRKRMAKHGSGSPRLTIASSASTRHAAPMTWSSRSSDTHRPC